VFTGIIAQVGTVASLRPRGEGVRLVVRCRGLCAQPPPTRGESISVSGCCLSLIEEEGVGAERVEARRVEVEPAEAGEQLLSFDVIPQTLANTTLGRLAPGVGVNLERACTPESLLGGHLVQGHVDAVARVESVTRGDDWRVRLRPPPSLMGYVPPRGSVAIDGVSLTVAELSASEGWFEVALIPETLERTTLGELRAGNGVNLECDAIVKAVIHWRRHAVGG